MAPVVAPVAVVLGAVSLWGASRIDTHRYRVRLDALLAEKRELAATLERIADTAWELRESEERYRSLIDAQGDLVVHRDADERITFVNPAFLRAFGVGEANILGRPLSLAPLEEEREIDGGRGHGEIAARDLKLMTAAGARWFSWVDIRIRDEAGALGPVYSVARDITARKEVELALVEAREKAEAASQAKSRFLATVSHEFRTPLNGILGLTGLLLETRLTPVQETYARGIRSSGDALLGLIEDMLDFSKIEAERFDLRPEPADLETLPHEIVELLAARAHAKGIDIVADIDPAIPALVSVDTTRLRQVLVNLVGNGVKFTGRGGVTLSASLEASANRTAHVVFSVSDSGPGIAPEDAERLFGEFEQADNAPNRQHGGTGLGLAISRRIVRRMGSDLTVTPRPGGGSVFRFALDLPVEAGKRPAPPRLDGRRILVVMPEGAEPPALVRGLEAAGAEARAVTTVNAAAGLAGAAVAAALPYDALLIDRRLASDPAMALTRLREAAGGEGCGDRPHRAGRPGGDRRSAGQSASMLIWSVRSGAPRWSGSSPSWRRLRRLPRRSRRRARPGGGAAASGGCQPRRPARRRQRDQCAACPRRDRGTRSLGHRGSGRGGGGRRRHREDRCLRRHPSRPPHARAGRTGGGARNSCP